MPRIGIRLAALMAALLVSLLPALALAADGTTPPPELVALIFTSWGKWSVVAGLGILVAVQVWRVRVQPHVWDALHPILRRALPPAISALTAAAGAIASGGTWGEFAQVLVVQWVTLEWAAGLAGVVKGSANGKSILPAALLTVLVAALLGGCAPSLAAVAAESPADRDVGALEANKKTCSAISKREMVLRRTAQVSAALAGGSGLVIIPVDDRNVQAGLAISAGVMGATAAAAEAWREAEAADFERLCQ